MKTDAIHIADFSQERLKAMFLVRYYSVHSFADFPEFISVKHDKLTDEEHFMNLVNMNCLHLSSTYKDAVENCFGDTRFEMLERVNQALEDKKSKSKDIRLKLVDFSDTQILLRRICTLYLHSKGIQVYNELNSGPRYKIPEMSDWSLITNVKYDHILDTVFFEYPIKIEKTVTGFVPLQFVIDHYDLANQHNPGEHLSFNKEENPLVTE